MKKNVSNRPKQITNRRARHDYEIGESMVAGIVLSGAETKALRLGHGHLRGAYANVIGNELWLVNATIVGTSGVNISETDKTRSRKLLVSHRDLAHLQAMKQEGRTIVPLEILTHGRYIKVRIAIGKGKKQYDKRETLKNRDESRRILKALKNRFRV